MLCYSTVNGTGNGTGNGIVTGTKNGTVNGTVNGTGNGIVTGTGNGIVTGTVYSVHDIYLGEEVVTRFCWIRNCYRSCSSKKQKKNNIYTITKHWLQFWISGLGIPLFYFVLNIDDDSVSILKYFSKIKMVS